MDGHAHGSSKDLNNQLQQWLGAPEDEHLEFKEAKNRFPFSDLAKHCCALANEGGGKVMLGVTNKRPRRVVGTQAFPQPEETCRSLTDKLHIRIGFQMISHQNGRVVVFEVPARPLGQPVKFEGVYWSREADSLVAMSEEKLRRVFGEAGLDFSADVCQGATLKDLDPVAIEEFRRRWIAKSGNSSREAHSREQLLRDAEVVADEGLTNAALILFGTRDTLRRYLAQAEVVFEYRSSDASGPPQQREEYRRGFFSFYDDLWRTINLRNDRQHYQEGLFMVDVPTFAERPVREAILNAVSHRNYQLPGSVFVRQYPRRLVVESPGGLPLGITLDNILDRQSPRNRRVADVFAKCGLVERSGQGMNLMFEESIRQGKLTPSFFGTDDYQVVVTLHGQVQDPAFVRFLEQVGLERTASFSTQDFLLLDRIDREEPVPEALHPRLRNLVALGVVESIGRGRGARYILARRFYALTGRKGAYTRRRGLDRETNKQLLLKHIKDNTREGGTMAEFLEVLPGLTRAKILRLLRELRREEKAVLRGRTKAARWYPAPAREGK